MVGQIRQESGRQCVGGDTDAYAHLAAYSIAISRGDLTSIRDSTPEAEHTVMLAERGVPVSLLGALPDFVYKALSQRILELNWSHSCHGGCFRAPFSEFHTGAEDNARLAALVLLESVLLIAAKASKEIPFITPAKMGEYTVTSDQLREIFLETKRWEDESHNRRRDSNSSPGVLQLRLDHLISVGLQLELFGTPIYRKTYVLGTVALGLLAKPQAARWVASR